MSDIETARKLSDNLIYWRAERPDEWTMDHFIREALKLEQETQRIAQLEAALNNIKRHLEMVSGTMAKSSAAWHIADAALNKEQGK